MEPQQSLFPPPNLPLLLSGETLYSWCGHVHLWNGNSHVMQTSRQLFGAPHAALLHDFPAFLNRLQEKTEGLLPPSRQIALAHTLLGYFLAFESEEFGEDLLTRTCTGNYPQLKYKLGIPASRVGASHPLKYCRKCLSEDLAAYGRGYWHLSHQFPSAFICHRHTLPLCFVRSENSPVHLRTWLLPEYSHSVEKAATLNKVQEERLLKLAQFSIAAAAEMPGTLNERELAWTYQSRIREKGMLTSRGSLKLKVLNRMVRDYYAGLEQLPGLEILYSLQSETGGFVGSIARKRPKAGHPLKHLLLASLLFDSWPSFMERYRQVQDTTPDWLSPPAPEASPPSDQRINRFTRLVRERDMSLRQAAKSVGISVTTATQWAKRHELDYTRRTQTLDEKLLGTVRTKLRKGALKKTIVATTSISLVSLNRLLAAEPELAQAWQTARFRIERKKYRRNWLSLIEAHPGIPVKQLRKIPGNGYQWLYRHDHHWLTFHLPGLFHSSS